MAKDEMTMEENRKYQIDQYLNEAEAEFDRILAKGERKRRIVRWSALAGIAAAAAHLKGGKTCSFILTCNEDEGTTSLLAYTDKK